MSKSRLLHNVVAAAYINDRSRNEIAQFRLTGGIRNKQGSNDARVRTPNGRTLVYFVYKK